MECPYSSIDAHEFDNFCGEASCYIEEAKGVINCLLSHAEEYFEMDVKNRSCLCGSLHAVERSLEALWAFMSSETDRYFAQEQEYDKKRALAGCGPAKALSEDRGLTRSEKQHSTTEDTSQQGGVTSEQPGTNTNSNRAEASARPRLFR